MAASRSPLAAVSLFFCIFLLSYCTEEATSFSEENPLSKRILVIVDDMAIASTHSLYFDKLKARGYILDLKLSKDSTLALMKYGEALYDALIIFAPKAEYFGGSIDVPAILEFIDIGHDLILAAEKGASEFIREIANECGVDFSEDSSDVVVDHVHFAPLMSKPIDHSVIVTREFIKSEIMVGWETLKSKAPVLFQGISLSISNTSDLVLPVLSAPETAYTGKTNSGSLSALPSKSGKQITLVSAVQARNDARIVVSGSLKLFSDEFFSAVVNAGAAEDAPSSDNTSPWITPSTNLPFADSITQWALHGKGHLKAVNLRHHKSGESAEPSMYRINDFLDFSLEIFEWAGEKGEWIPYSPVSLSDVVQVQFYMMSPYVLKNLTHDGKGLFSTSFQVPDVYGVFQFKIEYKRLGYSKLSLSKKIPVRPFRHDEFERFIPSAFPYYASTFSMMLGFFIFGFVFLYHK